jgi:hypothetical protein
MMRTAQRSEIATQADDIAPPDGSPASAEACVAQALACLKEAGDNPDLKHYWMAQSVLWLQRAGDVWKEGKRRSGATFRLMS